MHPSWSSVRSSTTGSTCQLDAAERNAWEKEVTCVVRKSR